MRLAVLAYAFYRKDKKRKEKAEWKPPTKAEIKDIMANMMNEI